MGKAIGDVENIFWLEVEEFPWGEGGKKFGLADAGCYVEEGGDEVEETVRLEGFEDGERVELEVACWKYLELVGDSFTNMCRGLLPTL